MVPWSKPYPPSLVLKIRTALWSEFRARVRRSPHLAVVFRNLWSSTMERSRRSSITISPSSSAPSSPTLKSNELKQNIKVNHRQGTRRKGQPQKIRPSVWESDNILQSPERDEIGIEQTNLLLLREVHLLKKEISPSVLS